jgi:hypothetical protein
VQCKLPVFLPMMVSTDGNGWSSCIDDNNYDNIKINFDMWCQPPHTTNLYNLVQSEVSAGVSTTTE